MKDRKFQEGKALIRQLVQQYPGCAYPLLKKTVMTQLSCSQSLVSRCILYWKCLGHIEVTGYAGKSRYFWTEEPKAKETNKDEVLWEDDGAHRVIVKHVGGTVTGKPRSPMEWAVQHLEAA